VGLPASERLAAAAPAPAPRADFHGAGSVLVVDDEDDVLETVSDMLGTMGFAVLSASGGAPGVELFRQHADDIAFVMCDVAMPGMSGEELVRAIRAIRPDVRVALMSGFGRDQVQQRLDTCRVDHVIQKPFALDALRATARSLMGGAASPRG
jgi:CheY-like chemotaxis protein